MIQYADLVALLSRLIGGSLSLDEFEDRFVVETWNSQENPDQRVAELTYAVELRLAEHSAGHLPYPALLSELNQMVSAQQAVVALRP